MEIKSLLKNIGVSVINSGCDPLKSAVSLKENPDRKKHKKKQKNYVRYQVGFLLPLKLPKICYFGL